MKHITDKINESKDVLLKDCSSNDLVMMCTNILRKLKVKPENTEKNDRVCRIKVSQDVIIEVQMGKDYIPGPARSYHATYMGEGTYNPIVKILDSDNLAKQRNFIVPLLEWAKEKGYREMNFYRCAQWGTWKFGFETSSQLEKFLKKCAEIYDL